MNFKDQSEKGKYLSELLFLKSAFKAILKKWFLIIVVVLVSGGLSLGGTLLFVPATYESDFLAYINNNLESKNNDSVSTADISAARDLTSTYATIIKGQIGLESAIKESKLDMTYKEATNYVSVKAVNNTEVIEVSVLTTDANTSYELAKALEKVMPDYVQGIVTGSSMTIITPTNYPDSIAGPNYTYNTLIGMFLGGIFIIAYLFIVELMDYRIKSVDELSQYNIPVIGAIHDMDI